LRIKCLTEIFCADNFACFFLALKQIHKLALFLKKKQEMLNYCLSKKFQKKNWSSMEEGVIILVDHFLGNFWCVSLSFYFFYSVGGNE